MGNLALADGSRTRVYNAVVLIMKSNPVLSSITNQWLTWNGKNEDTEEIPYVPGKINIRLTPRINALSWWTPDSMKYKFSIGIEATISGTDIRDMMNLQDCIENCFYPIGHDAQIAIAEKLRLSTYDPTYGSGAMTGQAMFTTPMNESGLPASVDNNFYAIGEIEFEMRRGLNQ